jgi:hypothetical protein
MMVSPQWCLWASISYRAILRKSAGGSRAGGEGMKVTRFAVTTLLLAIAPLSVAQKFPDKPVRLVSPKPL